MAGINEAEKRKEDNCELEGEEETNVTWERRFDPKMRSGLTTRNLIFRKVISVGSKNAAVFKSPLPPSHVTKYHFLSLSPFSLFSSLLF